MRRASGAVVLVTALLAAAGCGDEGSTPAATGTETTETTGGTTLAGSVGPGFEISLDRTRVAAGSYELTVDDRASSHNFHLTGDGVDVSTEVGGTGASTFAVTLTAGTYTFVCDPHAGTMKGLLTVT